MSSAEVHTPLDVARIRADFPILSREIDGKPIAYLDSANSAQKPRQMIDAMSNFYATSYANVHRAVYTLGVEATEAFEGTRKKVRALLNAPSEREVIFTRDATEAINLVAYSYGRTIIGAGDVIVTTEIEHHSNLVPWQVLAKATGAELRYVAHRRARRAEARRARRDRAAPATSSCSRSSTSPTRSARINPIRELADWVHGLGGVILVDGAQSVPHRPVDVQAMDADFLAFSGHKLCGPSGAGALWGRRELLEEMPPVPDRRRDDPLGQARRAPAGTTCPGSSRPARRPSPRSSAWARRSTT